MILHQSPRPPLSGNKLNFKLENCSLCPHECHVNRLSGQLGVCRSDAELRISHIGLHYGEEPPISGIQGSGTIFFSHCNLKCVYCQNYQISQNPLPAQAQVYRRDALVDAMLALQSQGAHNINLVSPTHQIGQIAPALSKAKENGLRIPIVYNTNGYDSTFTIRSLAGLIDIYLADMKYGLDSKAYQYSAIKDYVKINRNAILAMFQQVGELITDANGIALKGLLIRHLVLPSMASDSVEVMNFIASLSASIPVSIMSQYSPQYNAEQYADINRHLTSEEYDDVVNYASSLGLESCFIQDLQSVNEYLPNFNADRPFSKS